MILALLFAQRRVHASVARSMAAQCSSTPLALVVPGLRDTASLGRVVGSASQPAILPAHTGWDHPASALACVYRSAPLEVCFPGLTNG